MARTILDTRLDSRTARSRLKPRGKPYYRSLETGLHLGYRKSLTGSGKWVCRHYVGDQNYEVETLAAADDFSDPDGVAILDYGQAQKEARKRMVVRAHAAAGKTGPLTVSDVMTEYLEFLNTSRKSGETAGYSIRAFIKPALGNIEVEALTTDRLRRWHHDLAKAGARIRTTKKGDAKQKFKTADGDDWRRRRRSTANRILRILKGGLNRAWREGRISSDTAWRRVEPFEGVEAARTRYLSIAECKRLINAAQPDFRALVEGALQTGARYGELCRLKVADFGRDAGTIVIRESKSGKPRYIVLTGEGARFFGNLSAGRAGGDWMFRKANGAPWARTHQAVKMKEASNRAGISPPINFHGLRHTWASHAVMNGVPLLLVAKNLGHRDTKMVEMHYAHLAAGFVVDEIRKGAPKFGVEDSNVVALER